MKTLAPISGAPCGSTTPPLVFPACGAAARGNAPKLASASTVRVRISFNVTMRHLPGSLGGSFDRKIRCRSDGFLRQVVGYLNFQFVFARCERAERKRLLEREFFAALAELVARFVHFQNRGGIL